MIYCISDIHGCYDEFMELLKMINFKSEDTLYVLGDVVDRGKDSIKCLRYIMATKNIRMLTGNHEDMMLRSLLFKDKYETWNWFDNGGSVTLQEFNQCGDTEQKKILKYLRALPHFLKMNVHDRNFILVHAGLRINDDDRESLSVDEILAKQLPEDMLWIREEFYGHQGIPEYRIIIGHTPIQNFIREGEEQKGILCDEFNDKILIDGGCAYGGRLYALCLDNMEEFYVEGRKKNDFKPGFRS